MLGNQYDIVDQGDCNTCANFAPVVGCRHSDPWTGPKNCDAYDPLDDLVVTPPDKECSTCAKGPNCGTTEAPKCLGPQFFPPYAYRNWTPRPEEEWIGHLAICGLGRIGYITGRKELPWGLSWVGIGLDGKEWSSRIPRTPTEDQVRRALKTYATDEWRNGFNSCAKLAEDATDGRLTLELREERKQ